MISELIHKINIFIHVAFGSLTLVLGIYILITKKGTNQHIFWGRSFLRSMFIVVFTAIAGVFLFKLQQFLFIISLISGYEAWSGYRVIKNKIKGPQWLDHLIAVLVIICNTLFYMYFQTSKPDWSPIIIYSTVGWIYLLCLYDLSRYFIHPDVLRRIRVYEHILKIIGSFAAICSAFLGTMLPNHQPYSQLGPSVLGILLMVFFSLQYHRQNDQKTHE